MRYIQGHCAIFKAKKLTRYTDYYRAIARSKTEKTGRARIQQGGQLATAALLAPL